jgi:two-component system, cell cycle sensor histidine kinase and response regulator CckA
VPQPRILVVDDEPDMCTLIGTILDSASYEAVIATHVSDALAHLDGDRPFDLAVLDVVMPKMSGDDLAREIKRRNPDAKVLFVTGYNEALFQARPVLWHGESFLDKPFTATGLLEAVSLALYGTTHPPAAAAGE